MLAAACSNPQGATPIPEPPALDPSKVGAAPSILSSGDPLITIVGERGATEAGATIRITNLDDTAAPLETDAAADGSFQLTFEVPLGTELRLQPILRGARGEPIDLLRTVAGELTPGPRHDCFRVAPSVLEFEGVEGGGSGVEAEALELENLCAHDASVDSSGTRLGFAAFALGSELPLVIPPQSSATVLVERDSGVTKEQEDVLFLTVSVDGTARRYPVTLFAPAR